MHNQSNLKHSQSIKVKENNSKKLNQLLDLNTLHRSPVFRYFSSKLHIQSSDLKKFFQLSQEEYLDLLRSNELITPVQHMNYQGKLKINYKSIQKLILITGLQPNDIKKRLICFDSEYQSLSEKLNISLPLAIIKIENKDWIGIEVKHDQIVSYVQRYLRIYKKKKQQKNQEIKSYIRIINARDGVLDFFLTLKHQDGYKQVKKSLEYKRPNHINYSLLYGGSKIQSGEYNWQEQKQEDCTQSTSFNSQKIDIQIQDLQIDKKYEEKNDEWM